jgi:sugar phosphate isomerase/epimerase
MIISRRDVLRAGVAAGAGALGAPSLAQLVKQKSMNVRLGATDWNLRQEGSLEGLRLGKKLGFEGVQVSLTDRRDKSETPRIKTHAEAAAHREEAKRLGIHITSTCLNILHINYLKNDKLGQKWVAEAIPITRAMNTKVILLPFFGNGKFNNRQEMTYVADFLKEIGPEAEKNGIILGLEDTVSAQDNMYMVERANSKAVKVYYDVGNSFNNGFDIYKEIRWLGRNNICEIHLKDNPHYLGSGKIDFEKVVNAIGDIGFQEWCVLETDSPAKDVEGDMRINLRFISKLFKDRAAEDAEKRKNLPSQFDRHP